MTLATVLGSQAMPAQASLPDALEADTQTAPSEAALRGLSDSVVINERTTVATAYALAQFINGPRIFGNRVGVRNAAAMVGNMVDVTTGEIAPVLAHRPNGSATSTLTTFNSLANMVAACIASQPNCARLFVAAPWSDGNRTGHTLQAIANIARNPWRNVATLFGIARRSNAYQPALAAAPDAWTIALKFRGNGLINGPGNFAFDAEGTAWLDNNYTPPSNDPTLNACDGKLLFRFTPTGQSFPGSPYRGGGISGSGYGITFDPKGNLWVGNFGFASPVCAASPQGPKNNSVSLFSLDGTPLSPKAGFTAGKVSWPQGVVSDLHGNIWIANCGNSSVTVYPNGDPQRARNIPENRLGLSKPFAIAIDHRGFAWVTGNDSNSVAIIGDGQVRHVSGVFDRPMAIASDSRGNMWVANSHIIDVPCPNGGRDVDGSGGSIVLIRSDGAVAARAPFTGGGTTSPWGISVDGNDNVWVANFGNGHGVGGSNLLRISQFCGADTSKCPPGLRTGDPISPPTGYTSDALQRMTAAQTDPSGNLWVTDNWKRTIIPNNPGGDAIVIFVGIAGPVKAPLIGPPQRP